jgi:hypothetical protein
MIMVQQAHDRAFANRVNKIIRLVTVAGRGQVLTLTQVNKIFKIQVKVCFTEFITKINLIPLTL